MGDSWEYRVIWEMAGVSPPDFHEDQIQAICDMLLAVHGAVCDAMIGVEVALTGLQHSGISSAAFDAMNSHWNQRGLPACKAVRDTISGLMTVLQEVLDEIGKWKIRLFVAMGVGDVGLATLYVGTGGLAALANHLGGNVVGAELRGKLNAAVDALEGKLVSLAINDTPLKGVQTLIEHQLQAMVDEIIRDTGTVAGELD